MVSVLLPTFNRATFLPGALEAIRSQTFGNWELIVVDDGSTDESREIVATFAASSPNPVRYVKQVNQGPYAARNTAVDLAAGRYLAFYDSDDVWFPDHLANCADALSRNADVDWVYAACRIVEYATGRIVAPSTFVIDNHLRPFRLLPVEIRGPVHVLDPKGLVECALVHGMYCGLQNSVLRRSVFDNARFQVAYRNEAEDQLFLIRALKRGHRLAYLDEVQVQYHTHDGNSSGSSTAQRTVERQLALFQPVVRGLEELQQEVALTRSERRAMNQRLNREYFWHLGYSVYLSNGRPAEALIAFRRGLRAWPWSARCWKTYAVAALRTRINRA
jgi:GT2 family glycosyltransferase